MEVKIENLKSIEVKDLLFESHYNINLIENGLPLRILYGDNGSGKTTLLKAVYHLLNGEIGKADKLKFSSIKFIFQNNNFISFEREENGKLMFKMKTSEIDKNIPALSEEKPIIDPSKGHSHEMKLKLIKDYLNNSGEWMSIDNDATYPYIHKTNNELIITDGREVLRDPSFVSMVGINPDIDIDFKKLNCTFIQTNRLVSLQGLVISDQIRFLRKNLRSRAISPRTRQIDTSNSEENSPLKVIQSHLKQIIEEATIESSSKGRKFDSNFFDLLLREVKIDKKELPLEDLKDELAKIDQLEQKLIQLGLYESGTTVESQRAKKILEEDEQTISKMKDALIVFNQGLVDKLNEYSDLMKKVENFKTFLDNHISRKKIIISGKFGFKFQIENGPLVNPSKLSSGEQHIVMLVYFLVFIAPKKSLVLIDEPEISLNLNWQRAFIKDILNLTKEKEIRFLIATHSPAIITNFRDQIYGLGVEGEIDQEQY